MTNYYFYFYRVLLNDKIGYHALPQGELMKRIVSILGARPQFIKAAAVSRKIAESSKFTEDIIHTGQHFDKKMSEVFFNEMEIPNPSVNLGISRGSHGNMTGRMMIALEKELLENPPDCILVYGDTNSTLAGALTGAKLHIPVAHVEAGLRSYNRAMPEELNRIIVDRLSVLLFCPSKMSAKNLKAEGIGVKGLDATIGSKAFAHTPEIVVTGDVMVDTIRIFREKAFVKRKLLDNLGIKPGSYILATVHREENTDKPETITSIAHAFKLLAEGGTPVVLPIHPRTRKFIEQNDIVFPKGVIITEPVSYLEMLMLIENSICILTDSGGLQKEALIIGRPCVTLRTETEWTETVDTGWNVVAGVKSDRILEAYHTVRNHASHEKEPPQGIYGDGHASDRIIKALEKRFC